MQQKEVSLIITPQNKLDHTKVSWSCVQGERVHTKVMTPIDQENVVLVCFYKLV